MRCSCRELTNGTRRGAGLVSHPSWRRPNNGIGRRAEIPLLVLRRRLSRGPGYHVVVFRGRGLGHGCRGRELRRVVRIVLPLVRQIAVKEEPTDVYRKQVCCAILGKNQLLR